MDGRDKALREFAGEVRDLGNRLSLVLLNPPPDDIFETVESLKARASGLLTERLSPKEAGSVRDIRDRLASVYSQLGPRLFDRPAWKPFEQGVRSSSRALEQLAAILEKAITAPRRATVGRDAEQPAVLLAAASYEWVVGRRPDLATKGAKSRNYAAIYQAIKSDTKESPYRSSRLPTLDTWKRQVRAGLKAQAEESG